MPSVLCCSCRCYSAAPLAAIYPRTPITHCSVWRPAPLHGKTLPGFKAGPRNMNASMDKSVGCCAFSDSSVWMETGCGSGSNGRGNIRGGGSGDGNGGGSNWGGFGDGAHRFTPLLYRALLGGVVLTMAMAASPPSGHATPGMFSRSSSTPPNDAPLSTSAPTHMAGLGDYLDRSSVGGLSRRSMSGSSPARPRSKVLHVACKGSTLVVPLPAGGETKEAASAAGTSSGGGAGRSLPLPLPHIPLWQRKKVVEAPIQLSEREARMLASRQNRVRDSVYVQ